MPFTAMLVIGGELDNPDNILIGPLCEIGVVCMANFVIIESLSGF